MTEARNLNQQIINATDPTRLRATLMELSDEAFQQFKDGGAMPAQLLSGYQGLDRRTAELAKVEVEQVAEARENRRLAQLEAEQKRQEEARLAAEAARKRAEAVNQRMAEAEAARKAEREAAQKKQRENLDQFLKRLSAAGIDDSLIKHVSVKGDTATITVANTWHLSAYQIRLQAAQNLWKLWASIASPKGLDKARIKLVDINENEVGGSRVLGGSLIWVQEN